jgi:hypothetical protein
MKEFGFPGELLRMAKLYDEKFNKLYKGPFESFFMIWNN